MDSKKQQLMLRSEFRALIKQDKSIVDPVFHKVRQKAQGLDFKSFVEAIILLFNQQDPKLAIDAFYTSIQPK